MRKLIEKAKQRAAALRASVAKMEPGAKAPAGDLVEVDAPLCWYVEDMKYIAGHMLAKHPSEPAFAELAQELERLKPEDMQTVDLHMATEFLCMTEAMIEWKVDETLPDLAKVLRASRDRIVEMCGEMLEMTLMKHAEVKKASWDHVFARITKTDPVSVKRAPTVTVRPDGTIDVFAATDAEKVELEKRTCSYVAHAIRQRIAIDKGEQSGEERRYVLGIVLEPDPDGGDTQGDTYTSEEVEKTAHRFMEDFRNIGLMHKQLVNGQVKILESYLAPDDFKIGTAKVKKGTWLMAVRVLDDELWEAVKSGSLTGFSIGGSAIREPVVDPV